VVLWKATGIRSSVEPSWARQVCSLCARLADLVDNSDERVVVGRLGVAQGQDLEDASLFYSMGFHPNDD